MEQKRKVLPPVYLVLSLVLMAGLHYLMPVALIVPAPYSYLGAVSAGLGIIVAAVAAGSFHKAGTPVIPFEPPTALVTGGMYKYTRNPMYLGMVLLLIGVAVLFGSLGAWLPVPFFIWVIQANFIRGEERFLESIFGEQYLEYRRRVRRWL